MKKKKNFTTQTFLTTIKNPSLNLIKPQPLPLAPTHHSSSNPSRLRPTPKPRVNEKSASQSLSSTSSSSPPRREGFSGRLVWEIDSLARAHSGYNPRRLLRDFPFISRQLGRNLWPPGVEEYTWNYARFEERSGTVFWCVIMCSFLVSFEVELM